MRLLVFGSRDWPFPGFVDRELDDLYIDGPALGPDPFTVISGGARGVDMMAWEWAGKFHISRIMYPADWDAHGRAAGPIRNQKMIDDGRPTRYKGFILNDSSGSMDMLSRLQKARIPGEVVYAYS